MDNRKYQFLKSVLGDDGARALAKAVERGPELGNALLPRTIMAWLGVYGRNDFEGQIPGVENTYIQFAKNEDRFSGSVAVGDQVYSFEKASMLHLGACMAVALGADHERVSPQLGDIDIQRLGKNIDLLVKARVAVRELRSNAMKKGALPSGGKEGPGPAHAPTAPMEPTPPTPPDPTQNSKGPTVGMKPKPPKLPKIGQHGTPAGSSGMVQQKPPKAPGMKVTKSQAEGECPVCAGKQFKVDKFVGCLCFRALNKSVKTTVLDDGYNLQFGAEWDSESILTLLESLGSK